MCFDVSIQLVLNLCYFIHLTLLLNQLSGNVKIGRIHYLFTKQPMWHTLSAVISITWHECYQASLLTNDGEMHCSVATPCRRLINSWTLGRILIQMVNTWKQSGTRFTLFISFDVTYTANQRQNVLTGGHQRVLLLPCVAIVSNWWNSYREFFDTRDRPHRGLTVELWFYVCQSCISSQITQRNAPCFGMSQGCPTTRFCTHWK